MLALEGRPHTHECDIELPPMLAFDLAPPSKSAHFKITISTNHPCVSLSELFSGAQSFCLYSSYRQKTNFVFFLIFDTGLSTVLILYKEKHEMFLDFFLFPSSKIQAKFFLLYFNFILILNFFEKANKHVLIGYIYTF